MNALAPVTRRPHFLTCLLGMLGGAALIITHAFMPGPAVILTYVVLVTASLAALQLLCWPAFPTRFWSVFLPFMLATSMIYVFIGTVGGGISLRAMPVSGHTWRLGAMAGVGSVLSTAAAYIAPPGSKRWLPLGLALGVLGGALLVVTYFFGTSSNVLLVYGTLALAYGVFVTASSVALRLVRHSTFTRRFWTAFLAFSVATALLYSFVWLHDLSIGRFARTGLADLSAAGHAWRLCALAVAGSLLSVVVAKHSRLELLESQGEC